MKTILGVAALSLLSGLMASVAHSADVIVDEATVADPTYSFYASAFVGGAFDATLEQVWNPSFSEEYYLDTGWLVGGTIGARFGGWARVEAELSYQEFEPDSSEAFLDGVPQGEFSDDIDHGISVTYLLANVWADIPTSTPITPYVGGGLGVAWVDYDGRWSGNGGFDPALVADSAFAWQIGAGVQYDFSNLWSLDLGYRYKRVEDFSIESDVTTADMDGTFDSHNVQLGIVRRF